MGLGRRHNVDALAQEVVHHLDHVDQRPPEPVELPDRHHVEPSRVGVRQEPVEAGTSRARPGDDVRILAGDCPSAPAGEPTELLELGIEILPGRADAGVEPGLCA
jgi:hypothetical protein